jgi:hypothetical protein
VCTLIASFSYDLTSKLHADALFVDISVISISFRKHIKYTPFQLLQSIARQSFATAIACALLAMPDCTSDTQPFYFSLPLLLQHLLLSVYTVSDGPNLLLTSFDLLARSRMIECRAISMYRGLVSLVLVHLLIRSFQSSLPKDWRSTVSYTRNYISCSATLLLQVSYGVALTRLALIS